MLFTFKWRIHFIQSFQLVDFEAMTTPSPDGFSKMAKSWMNLKRYQDRAQLCLLFHFWAETEYMFFFTPQPAQLVPQPSVCYGDVPIHQNHA